MGMDLKQFKARIEQVLSDLEGLAESSQQAAAPVELDQTRQGRLSRMDALQGQAMAQAGEARRQAQVAALKKALIRIEQGTYGQCVGCGEDIAMARLNANLAVTHCIECAEALD